MGSTVSTPWEYANQLLAVAQGAIDSTFGGPIPTAGGQGRALVTPGLPAIDCCPWLSVHIAAQSVAPTAPQGPVAAGHKGRTGFLPQVTFIVTVARCLPLVKEGQLPKVADLELAARQIAEDMWAITDAVRKADRAGTLFGGACRELDHLGATPLDPAGGCAGWVIRYRATVEGITA